MVANDSRERQRLKRLTARIAALADHKPIAFLELATALTDLKRDHTSDFKRVIIGAGLSLRKAYYLVSVVDKLAPYLETRAADLREIGWTKLSILAPKLGEMGEGLLDRARALSARQLSMEVRGQSGPPSRHCVLLYFDDEQYARLAEALIQHGAKRVGRGLHDQERALMSIIEQVTTPNVRN